jgi:hypothetical protein
MVEVPVDRRCNYTASATVKVRCRGEGVGPLTKHVVKVSLFPLSWNLITIAALVAAHRAAFAKWMRLAALGRM